MKKKDFRYLCSHCKQAVKVVTNVRPVEHEIEGLHAHNVTCPECGADTISYYSSPETRQLLARMKRVNQINKPEKRQAAQRAFYFAYRELQSRMDLTVPAARELHDESPVV